MNNIKNTIKEKILILDGATGTQIQSFDLQEKDFGGKEFFGCNEMLNVTRPDIIEEIHNRYLTAGADIIETNSFGGASIVLDEYEIGEKAYELCKLSAEIAKKAANSFSTDDKPRFVAGSVGPTTKMINVTRTITFDELKDIYKTQISGLIDGGADLILFETFPDTSNLKAGVIALKEVCVEKNLTDEEEIPFMLSVTIESNGTMLAGQDIEAVYTSIEHFNPLTIGINCGLGPKQVSGFVRTLNDLSKFNISLHPNAGLPDLNGEYTESPKVFVEHIKKFLENGHLNIIGGCCGTTPEHIKELNKIILDYKPRRIEIKENTNKNFESRASGAQSLIFNNESRPVMIGERTNMSGSKKFKKLIRENKFDKASDIAKIQVLKGAQVIDINLSDLETDEVNSIKEFYPLALRKIKTPIMIDTTGGDKVVEEALKLLPGKALINSINLEDEDRFHKIADLSKKYGAMIMALLIDDEKMAISLEDKISYAKKMYKMLTVDHQILPENIIFDTLVFPLGSGDNTYYKSAKYSIEAIKEIKKLFPETKFSLGISNCSFGLPNAGREALNSVYLYNAVKNGLDMAIVNSQKVVRYSSLSDEEKEICEKMLFDNNDDNVNKFIEYYKDKKIKKKENIGIELEKLSLNDKFIYYIGEGVKQGLQKDLDIALKESSPMEVINNYMMPAMGEVGKKFNNNELTIIEVLQSAEVMKEGVSYLESFLDEKETVSKGKMILATVKGDVHDIGKNLVEMVVANNGYEVIDLGIKVESAKIVEAVFKHKPDVIGLSGLLVKSALEMINIVEDLNSNDIDIPVIVGGAALSESFVKERLQSVYKGKVFYAKDAVMGLDILNKDVFTHELHNDNQNHETVGAKNLSPVTKTPTSIVQKIKQLKTLPTPDNYNEIILSEPELQIEELYKYINKQMLFGKHFGLKGNYKKMLAEKNEKAVKLTKTVDEVLSLIKEKKFITPKAIFQFFKVKKVITKTENILEILDKDDESIVLDKLNFPRQTDKKRLSIVDYISDDKIDSIALFCTTSGKAVTENANYMKNRGEYSTSHILYSLGLETAEAIAEVVHLKVRKQWGIANDLDNNTNNTIDHLFRADYTGYRYSPGYPACPDLDLQKNIFNVLDIKNKIGVELTEMMMMNPEASVSGIIIHHPEASSFSTN